MLGFKTAKFIVYSPHNEGCFIVIPITYDENFLKPILDKVRELFLTQFVIEYFEQRFPRDLPMIIIPYDKDEVINNSLNSKYNCKALQIVYIYGVGIYTSISITVIFPFSEVYYNCDNNLPYCDNILWAY